MCRFDRRRNNARSIVGQLILFFPPSFKGSRSVYIEYTRLHFYFVLCYPEYDIISEYPSVSFGDLIHHTVSASVSRVRLSPGDEIFDLRFVSFFPHFLFSSSVRCTHSLEVDGSRRPKRESYPDFLHLCSSYFCPRRRCRRRCHRRANTSSYFFTCEQVSDLRANLLTSKATPGTGRKNRQGRTLGRASSLLAPLCVPRHEGGSRHLLLNLMKLARAPAFVSPSSKCRWLGRQGRTLKSTWTGRERRETEKEGAERIERRVPRGQGLRNVCQYWKLHAKSRATFTGQLNYSE